MWKREKQGAPSSANPGQIYTRASNPPANPAPRVVWAWGQGGGLGTKTALGIMVLLHRQCPGGSELCQSPAATLILWHLWGIWKSTPRFPLWPCRWLRARDPAQGGGSGVPCPARAGRETALLVGRVTGQQHPWGLAHRLVSTVPTACWPVPSVPGLSRGRQAQPGGISPLCHPAVALSASKQGAQLCHDTPA